MLLETEMLGRTPPWVLDTRYAGLCLQGGSLRTLDSSGQTPEASLSLRDLAPKHGSIRYLSIPWPPYPRFGLVLPRQPSYMYVVFLKAINFR